MAINFKNNANKILLLLLLTDLGLMAVHLIHIATPYLPNTHFAITRDWGYGEFFQYIKEFWITVLLLILVWTRRRAFYLAWSALFGFLLLDDAMTLHEIVGGMLAKGLNLPAVAGLRAQDLGELAVLGSMGGLLLLWVAWMTYKGQPLERRISFRLLKWMVPLVLFGVVVDMVHVIVHWGDAFWAMLEDGGEMVIMSVLLWVVFNLDRPQRAPDNTPRHTTANGSGQRGTPAR